MNEQSVDQFQKIFAGNTDAYGLFGKFPNGDGTFREYTTVHKPPTKEVYGQHLTGEISLGIIPIRADGKCKFGAIDFDDHKKDGIEIKDFDYEALLKKIKFLKLPLIVFKSKSGGAHAYLFLQEWVPAIDVRHILKKMAYALGCSRDIEIFPKQDKIEPDDSGNFINLPYHAGNTRVAVVND
jgi:hypothetical protein